MTVRARVVLPLGLALAASLAISVWAWADGSSAQNQAAQSAPASVQVTTDLPSYAPGDTVTVAITNLGPAQIMPRGGRVCDSMWPISLEQQDQAGWSPVPIPQDAICAAVSVAPVGAGDSLSKTFASPPDGTYRVVFAYDVVGGDYGNLPPVYTDPFTVQSH